VGDEGQVLALRLEEVVGATVVGEVGLHEAICVREEEAPAVPAAVGGIGVGTEARGVVCVDVRRGATVST